MAIGDVTALPPELANLIQTGTLARLYWDAHQSKLAYAREASRETIPSRVGATYTYTRMSELPVSRVALDPASMTGLDNGMTADTFLDEQFTFNLQRHARTIDINLFTERQTIADHTMKALAKQGRQAARTRELLARYKLTNAYMMGNTIVINTGSAPTTTQCDVDDVRGFERIMKNGNWQNVSDSSGLRLTVSNLSNTTTPTLQVIAVTRHSSSATPETDAANKSSAKLVGGISGRITFTAVGVAPVVGDVLKSVNASVILRPNGKTCTKQLQPTDLFNLMQVMSARTVLSNRGVEPYDDGLFRCICTANSMNQLFADPDFKNAATGQMNSPEMQYGRIVRFQGVEYVETTEAVIQPSGAGNSSFGNLVSANVHRPILLGKGAICRADSQGLEDFVKEKQERSVVHESRMFDGIELTLRSPLDRLGEQFTSSWQMVTDYDSPTHAVDTTDYIPTTDGAAYKCAVQMEHVA